LKGKGQVKHTVEELELKNGARGLLIDVPGASVMSYQFHFRAGYRFVRDKSIYETAHIMEHMAFGANAKFKDSHAYEAEFTRNGAYHNAYTSDYSMVYVSDCADFEWDRILDLKRVAIAEPKFNQEELDAESGNVKSELTGYLNVHPRVLWRKMAKDLGEDILTYNESLKTINSVGLADIKEHYNRTHTSANLRFVIAGNMEGRRKQLVEMLEDWELQKGERLLIPVDELHSSDPLLIKRKESSNLTFGWSMAMPRRLSDEELDAMACVNHVLTGTLHSRILGAARKKGLAYHAFSDTSAYEHNSSWDFGAQANIDNLDSFFDIMVKEVKAVLNGEITDDEIDTAKSYALGKHQMGCQTVGQINGWYADRYFFDGHIEDYDKRPDAIRGVSKDQLVKTSQQFMDANCWMLGSIGSAEKEAVNKLNDKLTTLFT
jgi:predicted Zn-dependent peptidase